MCERMARTGFEVLFEFQSPGFVRESHVPGKVQRNEAQRRWSTPTIVLIKPPPQIPRKPNVPKLGMSPTSEAIDIVHVFLFIYFYLFSISILRSVGAKSPRLRASADLTRESHSDFAAPPSFAPLTKKPPTRRFWLFFHLACHPKLQRSEIAWAARQRRLHKVVILTSLSLRAPRPPSPKASEGAILRSTYEKTAD